MQVTCIKIFSYLMFGNQYFMINSVSGILAALY
jgi:hypothetical protein